MKLIRDLLPFIKNEKAMVLLKTKWGGTAVFTGLAKDMDNGTLDLELSMVSHTKVGLLIMATKRNKEGL